MTLRTAPAAALATALATVLLAGPAAAALPEGPAPAGAVLAPSALAPSAIDAHWRALGGTRSVLGAPVGPEAPVPGGAARPYAGGIVYWSAATGAWSVRGAVLGRYLALGGPAGPLGFPLTDESGTPDGVGRFNHFSRGGSVYWTPATGAHAVLGAIRTRWAALGWERGPMGYPVTDELGTPTGGGRYTHFSGVASIYWTAATGAHAVQGAVRQEWAALGWEGGPLGFPTTDETPAPDGVGRFNHFSRSASVYWTPATGAHAVTGVVRSTWAGLGWERSPLGYPVADEVPGGEVGRGVFEHGDIGYRRADGEAGVLLWTDAPGFPTDPFATPAAGRVTLAFTLPPDADFGYRPGLSVEYALDDGPWQALAGVHEDPLLPGRRTATVTGLEDGRAYTVVLRARVGALVSDPSEALTVVPGGSPCLPPPATEGHVRATVC